MRPNYVLGAGRSGEMARAGGGAQGLSEPLAWLIDRLIDCLLACLLESSPAAVESPRSIVGRCPLWWRVFLSTSSFRAAADGIAQEKRREEKRGGDNPFRLLSFRE